MIEFKGTFCYTVYKLEDDCFSLNYKHNEYTVVLIVPGNKKEHKKAT